MGRRGRVGPLSPGASEAGGGGEAAQGPSSLTGAGQGAGVDQFLGSEGSWGLGKSARDPRGSLTKGLWRERPRVSSRGGLHSTSPQSEHRAPYLEAGSPFGSGPCRLAGGPRFPSLALLFGH